MKRRSWHKRAGGVLPRMRHSQILAVAFSWVMALQLMLHGVLMLLPVGGGGNTLGIICSINGPRRATGTTGNTAGQLPPCCSSGYCCCMPGAAPLPSVPTIPRMAAPMHVPFRPTFKVAHAQACGWQWQARAPPASSA